MVASATLRATLGDAEALAGHDAYTFTLVYAKQSDINLRGVERDESKFSNPDNDPGGPWMSRSILGLATAEQRPNLHYDIVDPETGIFYPPPPDTGWRYAKERMGSLIEEGRILFPTSPDGRPREKKFKERIRRVIARMRQPEEGNGQLPLGMR